MPELPEVETIVRQLAPVLTGRVVKNLEILDPLIRLTPPRTGKLKITRVARIGKEAALELAAPNRPPLWLVFHLRMTGRLIYSDNPQSDIRNPKSLRARLVLDRGALDFLDTRRLGTMRFVDGPVPEPGLDPMTRAFATRALAGLLAGSPTPIKPWLMRQDRLAGIGNIYASEALFNARIDPRRPAGGLNHDEIARLRQSIRLILSRAIRAQGTTFSDYRDSTGAKGRYVNRLAVYNRKGAPCPRCGAPIDRIVQAQRSTFLCPRCQK